MRVIGEPMSFNYSRIRRKEEEGQTNWWTSYADLFMMLSVVFLLMYVSASLRSGTAGYLKQLESQRLSQENNDLKEQIKVYNALREQQLQHASTSEQEVYQKLMGKLALLREQAKSEKDTLRKQAKENEDKEFALNEYQQIIRNIINANILAKAQIQRREQIIQTKEQTLTEKEKVITSQEQQIREKEQLVAQNEREIEDINEALASKISQLKRQQKNARTSRKELERRITRLREESEEQIQTLQARSAEAQQQLSHVKGNLAQTENRLGEAQQTIAQQEQQKSQLVNELQKSRQGYLDEIGRVKAANDAKLRAERAAFQRDLERQNLTAAARAKALAGFAAEADRKAKAMEGQLEGLNGKVRDTEARLAGAEREKGRYVAAVEGLKKEKEAIQNDLEKTRAMANARRDLARSIGDAFRKAGVQAAVDPSTGVVTLDFGEEYFDTGSAALKPAMKKKLDQFFPIYTMSLFNNSRSSDKIANVEIIGFASSTFRGKYVNPNSLKVEDRDAVNYNLRLSFSRANEIFKHIYTRKTLTDEQKKRLLPLIKVVGRGYLPEGKTGADIPDGMHEEEFCRVYNCKKAQRVVVKFNLKD
jgi:hypothetical protein